MLYMNTTDQMVKSGFSPRNGTAFAQIATQITAQGNNLLSKLTGKYWQEVDPGPNIGRRLILDQNIGRKLLVDQNIVRRLIVDQREADSNKYPIRKEIIFNR